MTNALQITDRFIAALLGLALTAFGAATIAWWDGRFDIVATPLRTSGLDNLQDRSWWASAMLVTAALCTLLSLRWLYAHIDRHRVDRLTMKGSSGAGRYELVPDSVVDAAATVLEQTVGVRAAKGRVVQDRGQLVAAIDVTIEPTADLKVVGQACDDVARDVQHMVQPTELRCRIDLAVARRGRALPRVG